YVIEVPPVVDSRKTAAEPAVGPDVPVWVSPSTNWSLRMPKYRLLTAARFSPEQVIVSCEILGPCVVLFSTGLPVQLPAPGGLYDGPLSWATAPRGAPRTIAKANRAGTIRAVLRSKMPIAGATMFAANPSCGRYRVMPPPMDLKISPRPM